MQLDIFLFGKDNSHSPQSLSDKNKFKTQDRYFISSIWLFIKILICAIFLPCLRVMTNQAISLPIMDFSIMVSVVQNLNHWQPQLFFTCFMLAMFVCQQPCPHFFLRDNLLSLYFIISLRLSVLPGRIKLLLSLTCAICPTERIYSVPLKRYKRFNKQCCHLGLLS